MLIKSTGLPMKPEQAEAVRRYETGERLGFSIGIDELMTYGYGELDNNGFWEFPLRYEYLRPEHRALVEDADKVYYRPR